MSLESSVVVHRSPVCARVRRRLTSPARDRLRAQPRAVRSDVDYDVHTVVSGDTLRALAMKFNTTVEALMETNGLSVDAPRRGDALVVGQRLLIPLTDRRASDDKGVKSIEDNARSTSDDVGRGNRAEKRRTHESMTRTTSSAVETFSREQMSAFLSHREETILVLCETNDCAWCDDVQPAWTAVAVCYANDPSVRVGRLRCEDADAKQFAGKYFRAKTFPTIAALPAGSGPVYRHASADRSVAALLEFAEEAAGRNGPRGPVDVGRSTSNVAGEARASEVGRYASQDQESAMGFQTPMTSGAKDEAGPINVLTDAFGNAFGIHRAAGTSAQTTPVAAQKVTSTQLIPIAVGGLVCAALLSAVANLANTVKDLQTEPKRAPKRVVVSAVDSIDDEDYDDDLLDDYDEALIEVSRQTDTSELLEWRALVVDEFLAIPARALLLIRVWFLIGERVKELKLRRSERRAKRRDDDINEKGQRDYY